MDVELKKKFTDKFIDALKPKEKMYQIRSHGEEGFGLRVLPSGFKNFFFVYACDGHRRQMNIGSYPDITLANARVEYAKAYAMLHDKSNPQDPQKERGQRLDTDRITREERRQHPTIAMLAEDYIEKYAKKRKSSWREDQRILMKDVVPVWGKLKTEDITRRDVLDLIEGMQGRGDGIITSTFKIIRKMFVFAVKQQIIASSPCFAFEKGEELPIQTAKERNLTESEVKAFWLGLPSCAISDPVQRILKLILVTGQRPGEVASMHTSEIDGRWWEFTPKETKITKEVPRKQRIYLTDLALSLIGDLDSKTDYVFPSHTDKTGYVLERSVSYALRRNLLSHEVQAKQPVYKRARIKPQRKKPFMIPDDKKLDIAKFTPHDLRRTCATLISGMGFSDEIVDAVLAHLKKGQIRTYNKNKYDSEKQQAMEAWERKLESILTGTTGKVIPIKSTAPSSQ